MDKKAFLDKLGTALLSKFGTDIKNAPSWQLHDAISGAVMELISDNWRDSRRAHLDGRRACYLSMEFLVGRAVYNNLLCLRLKDEVDEILKQNGRSQPSATAASEGLQPASLTRQRHTTCRLTATA